ncbi:MAG: membrane protein insertase YidC [Rickettsiales bacterium]|nr:membrane protein insertase YidC [Rickettsiales bacterium]
MKNEHNIIVATILSAIVLLGWSWFYEKPKAERIAKQKAFMQSQNSQIVNSVSNSVSGNKKSQNIDSAIKTLPSSVNLQDNLLIQDREEQIAKTAQDRVFIDNGSVKGSIYLKGARFDDLTLSQHFTDLTKKDPVVLFAPNNSKERYFADFGWVANQHEGQNIDMPNSETLWVANRKRLEINKPVTLSWKNLQNIEFVIKIEIDKDYLISLTQQINNNSDKAIRVSSYGRINRALGKIDKSNYILHEGPIVELDGRITETSYEKLVKIKKQAFQNSVEKEESNIWLGFSDKYWLSAVIPANKTSYQIDFKQQDLNNLKNFVVQFLSDEFVVDAKSSNVSKQHLFAGAKNVKLLDYYANKLSLKLFDRAIDFGWFYFLTKPFFFVVDFLYKILQNFGLAILVMTILVKLALFPMANKSFSAIAKMKKLQPKIEKLREKYGSDKIQLNKELMELYKREKVNPAAGCLPIVIQIPVFFALYKVLFVTIDMRHAPFYGWIKDLSVSDPTSIFNLFGLLPFPSFINIGIWPILMGVTMIIQQKLNPTTTDPIQAKIFKLMPYVLTVVLANFPAGLVIYWTWSNILSILQQWLIVKKHR